MNKPNILDFVNESQDIKEQNQKPINKNVLQLNNLINKFKLIEMIRTTTDLDRLIAGIYSDVKNKIKSIIEEQFQELNSFGNIEECSDCVKEQQQELIQEQCDDSELRIEDIIIPFVSKYYEIKSNKKLLSKYLNELVKQEFISEKESQFEVIITSSTPLTKLLAILNSHTMQNGLNIEAKFK